MALLPIFSLDSGLSELYCFCPKSRKVLAFPHGASLYSCFWPSFALRPCFEHIFSHSSLRTGLALQVGCLLKLHVYFWIFIWNPQVPSDVSAFIRLCMDAPCLTDFAVAAFLGPPRLAWSLKSCEQFVLGGCQKNNPTPLFPKQSISMEGCLIDICGARSMLLCGPGIGQLHWNACQTCHNGMLFFDTMRIIKFGKVT